jgi:hypothetical protein
VHDNLQKLELLIIWDLGDYYIQTSKLSFFGVFFSVNFFTPKLLKIRCTFFSLGLLHLTSNFQIKLSIHGSNLNSMFASMSELELFLLTGS